MREAAAGTGPDDDLDLDGAAGVLDDDARARHLGQDGDVAVERVQRVRALRERRLRELEGRYSGQVETSRDVHYLAHEVRQAQHALLQVMAAAMDAPATDAWASRVRFFCNQALGLYPLNDEGEP